MNQKRILKIVKREQEMHRAPKRFSSEAHYLKEQKDAERTEAFAEEQAEKGFPYLYAIATVKLWSILETMVDDITFDCLQDPQQCADLKLLTALEGPLLEFLEASPDDRAEFLAGQLKQVVRASLQKGVSRFEAMLKPLGLDGAVPDPVKQTIYEMFQVRNLLVHRRGIADKRFLSSCPWLDATLGCEITLSAARYLRYRLASMWYVIEMDARLARRAKKTPDKYEIESQLEFLQRLEKEAGL